MGSDDLCFLQDMLRLSCLLISVHAFVRKTLCYLTCALFYVFWYEKGEDEQSTVSCLQYCDCE